MFKVMAIGAKIKSALEIGGMNFFFYISSISIYVIIDTLSLYSSMCHRTHQDPVPRSQGGEGQGHPQDPHIMEI